MLTLADRVLLTATLTPLDVTAPGVIQLPAPLTSGVIVTVTTSLLVNTLEEKVAFDAPEMATPFTCHW